MRNMKKTKTMSINRLRTSIKKCKLCFSIRSITQRITVICLMKGRLFKKLRESIKQVLSWKNFSVPRKPLKITNKNNNYGCKSNQTRGRLLMIKFIGS